MNDVTARSRVAPRQWLNIRTVFGCYGNNHSKTVTGEPANPAEFGKSNFLSLHIYLSQAVALNNIEHNQFPQEAHGKRWNYCSATDSLDGPE